MKPGPLTIGGIRDATVAALRPRFWTLLSIAAPFTLLVDMSIAVFGPPQPRSYAEFTPQSVAIFVLLPLAIYTGAELAVIRLTGTSQSTPRTALAEALALFPGYLVAIAVMLAGIMAGLALLFLPGIYLWARLFVAGPVAIHERLPPFALIARSWRLTAGDAGTIFGFLVLASLFTMGLLVISSALATTLDMLLRKVGLAVVAPFAGNLINAFASMVLVVACATASSVLYNRLAGKTD